MMFVFGFYTILYGWIFSEVFCEKLGNLKLLLFAEHFLLCFCSTGFLQPWHLANEVLPFELSGVMALHEASRHGQQSVVQILLEARANVDVATTQGCLEKKDATGTFFGNFWVKVKDIFLMKHPNFRLKSVLFPFFSLSFNQLNFSRKITKRTTRSKFPTAGGPTWPCCSGVNFIGLGS